MGVLDRCTFVTAGAEDLSAIESESVDLVTTRSVLIYLDDKPRAFREFFPRAEARRKRTALFEPIDDRRMTEYSEYWSRRGWADPDSAEGAAVKDLIDRLDEHWKRRYEHVNDAMLNFNERDLLMMSVAAGFAGVHVELDLGAGPMPPMNWDTMMKSSGNPLIPTNGEVIGKFSLGKSKRDSNSTCARSSSAAAICGARTAPSPGPSKRRSPKSHGRKTSRFDAME